MGVAGAVLRSLLRPGGTWQAKALCVVALHAWKQLASSGACICSAACQAYVGLGAQLWLTRMHSCVCMPDSACRHCHTNSTVLLKDMSFTLASACLGPAAMLHAAVPRQAHAGYNGGTPDSIPNPTFSQAASNLAITNGLPTVSLPATSLTVMVF